MDATTNIHTALTIRALNAGDDASLRRLEGLDTRTRPEGDLLGAELNGELVAAISMSTGESIADPFKRTSEIRDMLELRFAQSRPWRRRRRLQWLSRGAIVSPASASCSQ